jgi:hypothetical protein
MRVIPSLEPMEVRQIVPPEPDAPRDVASIQNFGLVNM